MIFSERLKRNGFEPIGLACANDDTEIQRIATTRKLFVANEFQERCRRTHLDLIIELTGRAEIATEIHHSKPDWMGPCSTLKPSAPA